MRMNRLVMLMVITPVLALGAGVAAGMLVSRLPSGGGGSPTGDAPSSLTDELNLSPEQREQMRQIWEAARGKVHQTIEQAQNLQKQRDDALVALLDASGKEKFAQISTDFAQRDAGLTRDRDAAFAQAVQQTKALLNEQQWQKYDRILRTQVRGGAAALGAFPQNTP